MIRMFALLFLLLAPAFGLAAEPTSDHNVLAAAEAAFARGIERRSDSVEARPYFARAAEGYDELWRRGHRNPTLALNRAKAHRLAGDLPGSIAAFHDGLAVARYDRSLQAGLEEARAAVAYPNEGDLAAECQPRTRVLVGDRMSPAEAWLAAAGLWVIAGLAAARFWMTRNGAWLAFAGLCVAALLLLGGLWWQDARHQQRTEARPLVIVADDVVLQKGNGFSYPDRFDARLPKGVEARELTRRGGWVQVELAGGAVGWLPETAVLSPDQRP